jgi:hypothetical protein
MPEQEPVKFEGEKITLGGVEYVVPSLTVKQAKTLWPTIKELDRGVTVDNLPAKYDDMLTVIHAALSRNYPQLKIEELEEMVDMGNIRLLMKAATAQSGLAPVPGTGPAAK